MLRDWPVALGPSVPLSRASASLRWARAALALGQRGVIDFGAGVIRCDEHMSKLLIFSDEELAEALRGARLAPLDRLKPATADRLAETLLCWLQRGGNANEVAVLLHVHPQTVRYRLRRIDELFGGDLRDPDRRVLRRSGPARRRLLEAGSPGCARPGRVGDHHPSSAGRDGVVRAVSSARPMRAADGRNTRAPCRMTYQADWPDRAAALATSLRERLAPLAERVEHIGSTSIPGMAAKDILDVQVSVADLDEATRAFDEPLAGLGFELGPYRLDQITLISITSRRAGTTIRGCGRSGSGPAAGGRSCWPFRLRNQVRSRPLLNTAKCPPCPSPPLLNI